MANLSLAGVVGLALAATLLVNTGASADAQGDPDQVVIFVLDLSGSMNEPFGDSTTKLDVAKAAFVEAFNNVAPDALVGLRTYGDQIEPTSPADREPSCTTDTRLVTPVSTLQREELIAEVQGFSALGDTPMGLAIETSAADVPSGAVATIVLFSDGRDECYDADLDGDPEVGPSFGDDPCTIAKRAVERSDGAIDRIVTVGFGADEAAESELRCIAESTGGSYTAIATPEDARDVLPDLLAQFSAPREAQRLEGVPIVGTDTTEAAPEFLRLDIENATRALYTDSIAVNTEKVYSFPRFGPGPGTFTATVFGLPAVEGITFDMRLWVPELDRDFFGDRGDANAGLPERPTASIRCTDCSVPAGPHDAFWIVSLASEDPSVTGTYELEIVTDGPGFGGPPSGCQRPQECWYPHEIASVQEQITSMQADMAGPTGVVASAELIAERDELEAKTEESQTSLTTAGDRITELEALIETAPVARSSYTIPVLMVVLGAGLALAPVKRKPKSTESTPKPDDADKPEKVSRRSKRQTPAATQPTPPTKPAGIVMPAPPTIGSAASPSSQNWAAELAAAKEALVQQRPAPPRRVPPAPRSRPVEPTPLPAAAQHDPAAAPHAAASRAAAAHAAAPQPPEPQSPEPQPAAVAPAPQAAPALPPPGWYRDPAKAAPFRWWDGTKWTTHTSDTSDPAEGVR